MRIIRTQMVVLVLSAGLFFASHAWAASWKPLAQLNGGGKAKEVAINQTIRYVRIAVLEGSVVINTIVVREGAKKTPNTIARQFGPKERFVLTLPAPTQVTGLRISDSGGVTYMVQYK